MLKQVVLGRAIAVVFRGSIAALLAVCVGGCYRYRTVTVTVLDAATSRPIPAARVDVGYNEGLLHAAPRRAASTTGSDGVAQLSVANDPLGATLRAEASGYATTELTLWPDADRDSPPWPYGPVTLELAPGRPDSESPAIHLK